MVSSVVVLVRLSSSAVIGGEIVASAANVKPDWTHFWVLTADEVSQQVALAQPRYSQVQLRFAAVRLLPFMFTLSGSGLPPLGSVPA